MSARSRSASLVPGVGVAKGDVLWVPFRRDPLWPALIQNVYPKKLTYVFFPLPTTKTASFKCSPKNVFALGCDDCLPPDSSFDLLFAYSEAVKYLKERNWQKGSSIARRPVEEGTVRMDDANLEKYLVRAQCRSKSPMLSELTESTPSVMGFCKKTDNVKKPLTNNVEYKPLKRKKELVSVKGSLKESNEPTKTEVTENCRTPEKKPKTQDLRSVIFERVYDILDDIWNATLVNGYNAPPRSDLLIKLPTARFISDDDADRLFEIIMGFIQERKPDARILLATHYAAETMFPEVMIRCIQTVRDISYNDARQLVCGASKDSENASGLDELVRVACEERARGSQK